VRLRINTREDYRMYTGKNGVYSTDVEIIAISENYYASISVYVVFYIYRYVGQIVNERNASL
jgi:hypothetical protein